MSRMTLIFAGLVTLAFAGVARADAPTPPFTITTVDEFERLDDTTFSLTGLVSGETTPRVMELHAGYVPYEGDPPSPSRPTPASAGR